METIHRDYAPRGVRFFFIYKALAHPETNGYIAPLTLAERLKHIGEAERRLGATIPWLCDTMANEVKHALGDAPNSEFVIDPDGRVKIRRAWSQPQQLRRELAELVGPAERETTVADLNLRTIPPPREAPTGIVPRVQLPSRFQPLRVQPGASEQPFYAKLRVEADDALIRSGEGQLLLRFALDPLYGVHWNNLAAPIRYRIVPPPGVTAEPAEGTGPQVEAPADSDPREFLVKVAGGAKPGPLWRVEVEYFACNDDEGWCKPVSQVYQLELAVDRDGGWTQPRRPPRGR